LEFFPKSDSFSPSFSYPASPLIHRAQSSQQERITPFYAAFLFISSSSFSFSNYSLSSREAASRGLSAIRRIFSIMIKTGPIITELASYLNSIEPIARTRHTKKVRPRLNAAISRVFALESNTA
jgi:hypothetical protein